VNPAPFYSFSAAAYPSLPFPASHGCAMPDLLTLAVVALGVFLIAFMRGACGGGFAIIGIPLLSLVLL
jgi:hypothetical protein